MRRSWTDEESNFILNNYKVMTAEQMAITLGRSKSSTSNKIYKLTSDRKWKWKEDEIEFLLNNYESMTYNEIAKKLNKTESSVTKKLQRFGIFKSKENRWTEQEDKFLEDNWGIKSIKALAKHLGRSENAVKRRGYDKGFGGMYFDNLQLRITEIRDLLNVDRSVIENWMTKKGLPYCTRTYAKKKTIFIKPKDLYNFLKKNQHLWNAAKLEEFAFGVEEEEWLINKRISDKNNLTKMKSNTPWTRNEENSLIKLLLDKTSIEDICKILNRSENSILCKRRSLIKQNRLIKSSS